LNEVRSSAYRSYLLALLTGILMFNFVDRFALGLILQDIKADLLLSDTQLGVLTGIAFALFYSVMGLPIARWADRGDRVTITSLTCLLWSGAVALCGAATSFAQLLLIRVGVAVGEAGAFAPGLSLISDHYCRAERPRAVALYALGGPLSAVVGYLVAGWLSELYGWRAMFVLLGVPGLLLAALARFTLQDPRRAASASFTTGPDDSPQPSVKEVCASLGSNATFRHLLLCLAVLFFFIYGVVQWQPSFFIRSHGFTSAQVGTAFALIYGGAGLLGTYLGGELASRYAARNEALQLRAIIVAMAACAVLSTAVYVVSSPYVALALIGAANIAQYAVNGPLYATLQTLVPRRMRALSVALVLLFANLIGMGLGPLATGALSDAVRPWAGEESLRYALVMLSPGYLWVGWHAWRASRTVARDLGALEHEPS
jgi:MFS transporter, Spinster family, sphingosine-1-phosphate transporter